MNEPFFFGVPLIARSVARDWSLVGRLLGLTLRSVLGQRDRDFRLLLAGHDLAPEWHSLCGDDPRFAFLAADWTPEPPTAANDDGGRKKWLIKREVREAGGGLLMFLDADDLIDRDLVGTARQLIGQDEIGGIVVDGIALDLPTLRAAPFPIGGHPFHGLCGSSTIGRVDPDSSDPLRLDPHEALGWHGYWEEGAARHGVRLARLPIEGAYLVGTSQNHSEQDGPHASWRRELVEEVRRTGRPLTAPEAARFGLNLEDLAEASGVLAYA